MEEHIGEVSREASTGVHGNIIIIYKAWVPTWYESFDVIGKQIGECLESYNTKTEKVISVTIAVEEPTEIVCRYVGD